MLIEGADNNPMAIDITSYRLPDMDNVKGEEDYAMDGEESDTTPQFKSNNPFLNHENESEEKRTPVDWSQYTFKTLERILDDMSWTILYKLHATDVPLSCLLNRKPIAYAQDLAAIVRNCDNSEIYETLILNEMLPYAPSVEKVQLNDEKILTTIRGLLGRKTEVNHFRILVLKDSTAQSIREGASYKHDFHVISKDLLDEEEIDLLLVEDTQKEKNRIVDDAFFKISNSDNNVTLRVTIFYAEFENEDLKLIRDPDLIKKRYLSSIENNDSSNLSPDIIPSSLHCFKTLIKVLKGPVLLAPDDTIKTININNVSLNAQIDTDLLLRKLSFTLKNEELVPPDVNKDKSLRESYIRKVLEVIYLARYEKAEVNEFKSLYSYSRDLSHVYRALNEFDTNMMQFKSALDETNKLPSFISLSVSTFYPDELVIKCFENTLKSDESNSMFYLDCLKSITTYKSRYSNVLKLRTYFTDLSQNGELIGYSDYREALNSMGIPVDFKSAFDFDDDVLIANYKDLYKNDPQNYSYYHKLLKTISKGKRSKKIASFLEREIIPLDIAISELSIEEITEDEVVITAYEFKLDEILTSNGFNKDLGEILFLNKSLLSVAVNRKSYMLMNYLETKLPSLLELNSQLDCTKSFEAIGSSPSASDFEIITNFEKRFANVTSAEDIIYVRQALRFISKAKDSKVLKSYLATGKIDSSLLPVENWPAGLDNIGNTCYLNSLLQYYFCIKPLRDMVLSFNEHEINHTNQMERKIGGRKVEKSEIQRSNQFIYQLRNLFDEMIHSPRRCVQPTKELAYLAFLQLSQPVEFGSPNNRQSEERTSTADIIDLDNDEKSLENKLDSNADSILVRSQSPQSSSSVESIKSRNNSSDVNLQNSTESVEEILVSSDTSSETQEMKVAEVLPICGGQIDSTIEVGRQQDVTECIENVTYQLETALQPVRLEEDGEQYDIIKQLFYGKTKQTITPLDDKGKPRTSFERFFSLIINVNDHPKDIYESLDNYFSEDVFNLDEGPVRKAQTILELPEILQFHVQRVLFDKERLMAYKSLEPIPFDEKIYLDRYMDTNDEDILSKRKELFKWKKELRDLEAAKERISKKDPDTNMSVLESLITTKKYLENILNSGNEFHIDEQTLVSIESEIQGLKEYLTDLEIQISTLREKISNQFNMYKKVGYSIFAIFIHRGEASYGHYWIYIKDPKRNIYRKYNDETVTEVPLSEVMNFESGNTSTPYYIVYVKSALQEEYIEPLKREICAD